MGGIDKIYPAHFLAMSLKYLLYAGLVLVFSGGVPINSAPSGFLIGHLKIVFLGAAESAEEPSDEMPRPAVDPETYGEYPLIILSPSDKKEIAHVTADA